MLPNIEDDALSSRTSSKDPSPLHHPSSLRQGGSSLSKSRSTRVIQDSEDEVDDNLDVPEIVPTKPKDHASRNIEVVIPVKKDGSPSASSRSSLTRGPSVDGTTGFNTPATSVGVTPDLDIKQPHTRINASERASRLRSSRIAGRNSQRGTKRPATLLSSDEVDSETTDAALAYALQVEEFEQPAPKKQKTVSNSARDRQRPKLQELPGLLSSDSELSDDWSMISSLPSEPEFAESADDSEASEEEDRPLLERRGSHRRQAFFNRLANYGDEDEDESLPTWVEQRKLRRVRILSIPHI